MEEADPPPETPQVTVTNVANKCEEKIKLKKISRQFASTCFLLSVGERRFVQRTPEKDSENNRRGTATQTQLVFT